MAVTGMSLQAGGSYLEDSPGGLAEDRLLALIRATPPRAPIVILIHGFRFDFTDPANSPHSSIFALDPARTGPRIASWPRGLGFTGPYQSEGLCIGYAWSAAARHRLIRAAGFADAYRQAETTGTHLARLLDRIATEHPDRRIDLFAHSLGARVALQAARQTRAMLGRVLLLGAAEYATAAAEAAAEAYPETAFYNISTPENALYDFLFERAAPGKGKAVASGLPTPLRNWIDLPLDTPITDRLLKRRNAALTSPAPRTSHWSLYTRPGTMALYRAILRQRHNWTIPELHREIGDLTLTHHRSGFLPRWPGFGPSTGLREV